MPNFHVISDIHLEYLPRLSKLPGGEYLLLCGDIGKPHTKIYHNFIETCSKNYKKVFIVCGNHEYYGQNINSVHKHLEELEKKYNNVYFLNNRRINCDDFIIIGTVLWSDIPPEAHTYISDCINDYRYIKHNHNIITPKITAQFFKDNVKFLEEELKNCDKPTIVMTHHAPLLDCVFPHYKTKRNCAFCSDLTYLLKKPIVMWAFGHTHCPFNEYINGVHLINNPLGYPNELKDYDTIGNINLTL